MAFHAEASECRSFAQPNRLFILAHREMRMRVSRPLGISDSQRRAATLHSPFHLDPRPGPGRVPPSSLQLGRVT